MANPNVVPSGYDLFSVDENFLTDLSTENESMIAGGGKRGKRSKSSKSRSSKSRSSKSRSSKSRSRRKRYHCYW